MIQAFEEAICDDLLSHDWRQHCMRAFKQLKPILYEIMTEPAYKDMSIRFSLLEDYFLNDAQTKVRNV
jgi:hypothetical protein